MTELTVDFDEPYIGGTGSSGAVQLPPWAVAINGRQYLLDTAKNYSGEGKYKREGIDVLQQRNTNNQRDTLLLPQDIWRQQQESWHQGAGQRNLDREDALPYRFSRSYGINPWAKYEISLLNETTRLAEVLAPYPTFLQAHDGWLVAVGQSSSLWWETPTSTPELLPIGSQAAISTTYDGSAVIVLSEDGEVWMLKDVLTATQRTVTPPVSPAVPNPVTDATFVAYVKDYLLLGVGNQLWNITAEQAVLVYTSPVAGFTWKGAAEGNQAIYCIGGAGDKHVVHRIGVKQDGTGLDPAVTAASLPDGETGVAIGSYLGYVFIGTSKGVRMATPSTSQGDLVLGALIPTGKPVYGFEGQDRFIWVTGSEINPVPDTGPLVGFPSQTVCGLFRADLSTFTVSSSTPAYATDIVATDVHDKTVRSVVTWNDVRVFSIDGGGVYMESSHKMKSGWLDQGRVSYSVEDLKTGLYVQAKWEPLHGSVSLDMSYDDGPSQRVLQWAIQGSTRSGNITLNGAQFSRVDARIILTRDPADTTKGPVFTRYELRARAVKGAASRWTLPLINHEQLDLNGVIEARDVTVEYNNLMNLVESGKMFTLQEWGRAYQVVVKDFVWNPQKLDAAGAGWQGVFTLIVEEVR